MASHQARVWIAGALIWLLAGCAARAPERVLLTPRPPCYVFTDQVAVLPLPPGVVGAGAESTPIPYKLTTITRHGFGPTRQGTLVPVQGQVSLTPLTEGIHILTLTPPGAAKSTELRFVALAPPPKLDRNHVALRHSAEKLFSGQPYTIVAMGDSVTATGDYAGLLATLLKRATGNPRIRVVVKAYPGRSIDATVRHFGRDFAGLQPDLGLLMYGLNDQGGGVPLAAYLEQYAWVARQFSSMGADLVFLTPTPDISRGPEATAYGPEIVRTIGYAGALEPLAQRCQVPLADSFHALWGSGGATLDATGRALWPVFPTSYSAQLSSMAEHDGKGDGIHPNVLGHLALAQAAYRTLMNEPAPVPPLAIGGHSTWTEQGLVSTITVENRSRQRRRGSLTLYPLPDDEIATADAAGYDLAPGARQVRSVRWPRLKTPDDLRGYPAHVYAAEDGPRLVAIDYVDATSRPYLVRADFELPAHFVRARSVTAGSAAVVQLIVDGHTASNNIDFLRNPVEVPAFARDYGQQVVRQPLLQRVERDGKTTYAVAELVAVQYAAARAGEVTVDGTLDDHEWAGAHWNLVGLPIQARGIQGVADHRTKPEDAYLTWTTRAGSKGVYLAARITGDPRGDQMTFYFDPRKASELGTAGPYYWASLAIDKAGKCQISRGETSTSAPDLQAACVVHAEGAAVTATLEAFIPYELMAATSFPADGDLGFAFWWRHGSGPTATTLQWSEDAHPWNPRWFGVIRKTDDDKALPYMVRVR